MIKQTVKIEQESVLFFEKTNQNQYKINIDPLLLNFYPQLILHMISYTKNMVTPISPGLLRIFTYFSYDSRLTKNIKALEICTLNQRQ